MVYSGAWGKLIHEKNQKSKISWRCPFKAAILNDNDNPEIHHSVHEKTQFFLIQQILFAELADLPPWGLVILDKSIFILQKKVLCYLPKAVFQ